VTTVKKYLESSPYEIPGFKSVYYFEDDQGDGIIPQYDSLRHEMVVKVRVIQEDLQETASDNPDSHHSAPSDMNDKLSHEQERAALQREGEQTAARILGHHISAPTVRFLLPKAFKMREIE
jgi:hypothetical protein